MMPAVCANRELDDKPRPMTYKGRRARPVGEGKEEPDWNQTNGNSIDDAAGYLIDIAASVFRRPLLVEQDEIGIADVEHHARNDCCRHAESYVIPSPKIGGMLRTCWSML